MPSPLPSPSPRPSFGAHAAVGTLLGALASVACAVGDFGALWLYLPFWSDRLGLALRLVALLGGVGALGGFTLGAAQWAGSVLRLGRWAPLPHVVVMSPGIASVAWLLFSGGRASQLPLRPLWSVAVGVVLVALVWAAWHAARRSVTWALGARKSAVAAAVAGLFAVFSLLQKLDQRVLPNLYGYLHAALGVGAWLVAAWMLAVAAAPFSRVRARAVHGGVGAGVLGAGVAALLACLLTIDGDPNVRVALFDPRAATSRSVAHVIFPLLTAARDGSSVEVAARRARLEAQRRELERQSGGLPVRPDAHVVLLTIDALRADHLGLYGYARPTSPMLDALARDAVVFERAYTAAPNSSYSLSSMLTSEYVKETLDRDLPLPTATLPRTFAEAGYHTAAFYTLGIFHTEGERLSSYRDDAFGFALHDHEDRDATEATDRVLAEVDRVVAMGEPKTFFWAHYFDVHEPYERTTFGTGDVDRYDSEIQHTDAEIGRLVRELEARLEGDVVIVVTADHGEEFREHGGVYHGSTLYEEQVRVPLIVRAPGLGARRVQAPVQTVDIAPTVLALTGVARPSAMRGHDLRVLAAARVEELGPAFATMQTKRMAVAWPYKLVADLRFGTFELFDLAHDPGERHNLAREQPARVEALRDDVYAWLDSLSAPMVGEVDPRRLALERGRTHDRRAVRPLADLLLDPSADQAMRCEAARWLGKLADTSVQNDVARAMRDPDPFVAAEAAIALGRMYDPRARESLRRLVYAEDPDIRTRAAVSLGRLRDREAVPALIEALWHAETAYDREEAVRWLGRLRDPRAVEPLVQLLPELRTRHLAAVALGEIGDDRAYRVLGDMLRWEHHGSTRDAVVRGLGTLRDARAIPALVHVAATEADMTNAPESLVRLGAIERGAVGGADLSEATQGDGIVRCVSGPLRHDWDYQHRTWCELAGLGRWRVRVPAAVAGTPSVAILALRRTDGTGSAPVTLTLGTLETRTLQVDGQWQTVRFEVPRAALSPGSARVELRTNEAHVAVDHLLLVPAPQQLAVLPGAPHAP